MNVGWLLIIIGGIRSFFIEFKLFQLVVKEGGNFFSLRIFERGKHFMKSILMGKNAACWLMKNIEHTVVGINPKQFFMLGEGDTAYTLHQGTNSFGQFLLVSELKASGHRRSVIIPGGKAQNGWKVFRLELRKMLEPNQYALGGSGQAKFVSQPQRGRSGFHPSRSFAEILKGQVQQRDVTQLQLITTKDKDKNLTQGEFMERQNQARGLLAMYLKLTSAKVGEIPMGKPVKMVVGGGDRREQCSKVDTKLGKQLPVEKWKRIPVSFSLNSISNENGKRSDLRRSCWIGSGLIVQVDVKGRRRVSWDSNKGGVKSFKWVTRACKELGKGKLGLGSNKLAAQ